MNQNHRDVISEAVDVMVDSGGGEVGLETARDIAYALYREGFLRVQPPSEDDVPADVYDGLAVVQSYTATGRHLAVYLSATRTRDETLCGVSGFWGIYKSTDVLPDCETCIEAAKDRNTRIVNAIAASLRGED